MRIFVFTFLCLIGLPGYSHAQTKKPSVKSNTVKEKNRPEDNVVLPPPPPMESFKPSKPVTSFDTSAVANDELTAAIERMLLVSNAKDLGLQMAAGFAPQGNTERSMNYRTRFIQEVSGGKGKEYFNNFVVRIYREYFTLEEIKGLTAFYESAVGQKYIRVFPSFLAAVQQRVKPIADYFNDKVLYDIYQEQNHQK